MADYFETGFAVREPSWHGKELLLPESERPKTWEDARPLAGLTWDYRVDPMFDRNPIGMNGEEPVYEYQPVDGFQMIKRDDTNQVLHTSMTTYEVISIKEMGEIVHTITDEANLQFETMGSVREGRQVWGLIRLDDDHHLSNGKITDPSASRPYLGITNRTDGGGACRAFATSVRIVCWNTLSAAEAQADANGTVAVFRHQKAWRNHLEPARQAIRGARKQWDEWKTIAAELMNIHVDDAAAEKFVTQFIPMPPEREIVSKAVITNIENCRTQLRTILHGSKTSEGIQGNAYWIAQGATEYLDHMRSYRDQGTYVTRCLLRPEKAKSKAIDMIREIAKESKPAPKPSRSRATKTATGPKSSATTRTTTRTRKAATSKTSTTKPAPKSTNTK